MGGWVRGLWPRRSFNGKVVGWLAVVGLIVVATTALIFVSITRLNSSTGWVQHSYQILDTLDVTAALFGDAEAAERGYVATCKVAMISPFRSDLPRIYANIATLKSLTADNPAQQARVDRLHSTLSAELGRMSVAIKTTLKGDQKSGLSELDGHEDLSALRNIHAGIATIRQEERKLLDARLTRLGFFGELTLVACALGVLVSGGILGFVLWLIRRETTRRERSEISLRQSNAKLETSMAELQLYNESSQAIGLLGELLQTCHSTAEALEIVATNLGNLMPGISGTIGLFDESRERIETAATFGDASGIAGNYAPDDCWALRRGRRHMSAAGRAEPRCSHLGDEAQAAECIPLVAQGQIFGVLSMRTQRAEGFSDLERQVVQTITEQLSLALANLRLQETLRNQSLRDPLTGIFNRRYLDERLPLEVARARRNGQPLTVAMLDIDHFKRFNDTYGHEGGDTLLVEFAQLVKQHCRGEDIVCRYGGEEFTMILPGANLSAAAARAETLCAAVRKLRVELHGKPLGQVTVSVGLAAYPGHGGTGAGVLNMADAALYRAKDTGRDRVVVADDLHKIEADTGLPLAG